MKLAAIDHRKMHLIFFVLVCFAAVAFLFALLVHPKSQRLKTQHRKIAELKMDLREQQTLRPFYDDLIKKMNVRTPEVVSFPPAEALSAKNTSKIASICENIAKRNDLKLTEVAPSFDDADRMYVDVAFQGSFLRFRSLLMDLGRLPYLKHIEHMTVSSIEDGREIQLKLAIDRR
jgi:Tfp pilus assembly protein PilO